MGKNMVSSSRSDASPTQAALVAADVVKAHNMKIRQDHGHGLRDASGGDMPVVGSSFLYIRPSEENGASNARGKFESAEALITTALKGEIFLSWGALQAFGVIPPDFPHPRSYQNVCSASSRELNTVLKEYQDVFGEDLSGGAVSEGGCTSTLPTARSSRNM